MDPDGCRAALQGLAIHDADIGTELRTLKLAEETDDLSLDELKDLRTVLHPDERAARQALADAIAEELGHR